MADYWPALIGLVVGAAAARLLARRNRRSRGLTEWDARATLPIVLAAAAAHLALIPAVEPQRQLLFGLYAATMIGVAGFALIGLRIWRLGAILFPLGSIGAYLYFALLVHQADYIGLLVKLVEVAAVVAALRPLVARPKTIGSPTLVG